MARKPATDPLIGTVYADRFQVEAFLDSGVMGSVYRARHVEKDRVVALKVINAELAHDPEIVARFHREMTVTAQIKHPNTVRVYHYGHTPAGELYLAMELLEGRSLDDVLEAEAPLAPERVARIGAQIADALCAAHAAKVVHRDLKPGNIMLVRNADYEDWVKVLDFGLARAAETDGGEQLTAYGSRVGTPHYMAPEYVSTFVLDHRSDLYSLGVLLYEMLTGKPPFDGNPYQVLQMQTTAAVPPMGAEVPEWLRDLVMALLEKKPEDRPQRAEAVRDALLERAPLPVAAPASGAPKAAAALGIGVVVFAAVGAAVTLAVAAIAVWMW